MPVLLVESRSSIARGTGARRLGRFSVLGFRIRSSESKALLKPPLSSLESIQRIEQLKTGLTNLVCARSELLRLSNGEPDSIDRYASLIREFVVNSRRTRLSLIVNHSQNLSHHL